MRAAANCAWRSRARVAHCFGDIAVSLVTRIRAGLGATSQLRSPR